MDLTSLRQFARENRDSSLDNPLHDVVGTLKESEDVPWDQLCGQLVQLNSVDGLASDPFTVSCLTHLIGYSVTNILTSNCLKIVEEIRYYDQEVNLGLYTVQMIPRRTVGKIGLYTSSPREFYERLVRSFNWDLLQSEYNKISVARLKSAGKSIWKGLNRPLAESVVELKHKRSKLKELKRNQVSLLGWVINTLPTLGDTQAEEQFLYQLHSRLDGSVTSDESFSMLSLIQEVIPEYTRQTQQLISEQAKPSYLERHWPLVPLSLIILPKLYLYFTSNKQQIYKFVYDNIRQLGETVYGLWQNWIVSPLVEILNTIRHDPNSQLALMSEESLQSDLGSLKRMVIEYVRDNDIAVPVSGSTVLLSSLNAETQQQVIDTIANSVAHGDLSLLLQDYEQSLNHPLWAVMAGQMVRNVLIQVQKTKVDGAVALAGIDKIVRSQQLVFGCLAASPALFGVWYGIGWTRGLWNQERKDVKQLRLQVRGALGRALALADSDYDLNPQLDANYTGGLLFIETALALQNGARLMPLELRTQFRKEVSLAQRGGKEARSALERVFVVYGKFF